jgi:putative membrane protein
MFFETRAGRIAYVASLTLVFTGLGFWAAVEVDLPKSTLAEAALSDAPFAKKAELVELQTLKLAQLAQEKAKSEIVRNFAAQVLADRPEEADQLSKAAWKENISLPNSLATRDEAAYERIYMLNGPEFDKAYMQQTVRTLTDTLQTFRREAATGNDEVVRRFAAETIPVLENHLNEARLVMKKLAAPSKKMVSSQRK